jgi:hypothetical protein
MTVFFIIAAMRIWNLKNLCHTLKMLCGRLAPRTGEVLGHSETGPITVARTQGRPQAVVSRRCAGVSLTSQLMGMSRDGKTHLQILCQPEQQHRARYQTEGSRGAVKDRSGNGFPVVKVIIYFGSHHTYPRSHYVRWRLPNLLKWSNQEGLGGWNM